MNTYPQTALQEKPVSPGILQEQCALLAQQIRMITLRFTIALDGPAILPRFKGSTLRGLFGRAFRTRLCICRGGVNTACVYHNIFESPLNDNAFKFLRHVRRVPHPFVLEVPLTTQQDYAAGESFTFGLRLFGFATDYALNMIDVVETMGRMGLTKERIPFRLLQVHVDGENGSDALLYNGATKQYRSFPRPATWRPIIHRSEVGAVEVEFVTPATFQKDGNLTSEVDFSLFAAALVRRIAVLAHYAEGLHGVPGITQGEYLNIDRVRVAQSTLRWCDTRRYSNNQQAAMLFGGVVGTLRFEGELGSWIPLIEFGRYTHVGKRTAFGFGQYHMEVV